MLSTYEFPVYEYKKTSDQTSEPLAHHPIVIVGAGPVGLAAALDAGVKGMQALVLDDNNTVSTGSRAVCYSKRSLEIMNRLGCAEPMLDKGVTWNVGKIFFQDELIRQFDLLPASDHQIPAFINLQQYYLEEYMVSWSDELDGISIRWKNKVIAVAKFYCVITAAVINPIIAAIGANGIRA